MLHYVEKPETFHLGSHSCGVYLFDRAIFAEIKTVADLKTERQGDATVNGLLTNGNDRLSLEQDLLRHLVEKRNSLYVHYVDKREEFFWRQIKKAESAIPANASYLEQMAKDEPDRLVKKTENGPDIIGAVRIHPTAQIDHTAKVHSSWKQRFILMLVLQIGPNVSIGPRWWSERVPVLKRPLYWTVYKLM